jgi:hypothetical protein
MPANPKLATRGEILRLLARIRPVQLVRVK